MDRWPTGRGKEEGPLGQNETILPLKWHQNGNQKPCFSMLLAAVPCFCCFSTAEQLKTRGYEGG